MTYLPEYVLQYVLKNAQSLNELIIAVRSTTINDRYICEDLLDLVKKFGNKVFFAQKIRQQILSAVLSQVKITVGISTGTYYMIPSLIICNDPRYPSCEQLTYFYQRVSLVRGSNKTYAFHY